MSHPNPMMLLIGAAQHPRYVEVADESDCERDFVGDLIELAEGIEPWGRRLIAKNHDHFEEHPFAFEYTVQEALGRWIVESIATNLDRKTPNPFAISLDDCKAFARLQHPCLQEDI
ncbi:hypothetical protein [Cobetia marina]|uniref:hypothetical protein n=1 Tax=Cobetia marina TaxID=28258 RepID=UPI001143DC50|nr:hypothetical protein [Cobetia marina]GED41219.1 hypothetical protein HHA02_05480 [Cobetia marina]